MFIGRGIACGVVSRSRRYHPAQSCDLRCGIHQGLRLGMLQIVVVEVPSWWLMEFRLRVHRSRSPPRPIARAPFDLAFSVHVRPGPSEFNQLPLLERSDCLTLSILPRIACAWPWGPQIIELVAYSGPVVYNAKGSTCNRDRKPFEVVEDAANTLTLTFSLMHHNHTMAGSIKVEESSLHEVEMKAASDKIEQLPEYDDDIRTMEKRLVRKLDMSLMPVVWILYFFNYMDRNNIA